MLNTHYLNNWILNETKSSKYITSNLFSHYSFEHFFFSRSDSLKSPKEFAKLSTKVNPSIHFLKQVHGNKVIFANQTSPEFTISADGLVSNAKNQYLSIYSADCIPILLADIHQGNVAASHAGWKGLGLNIIHNTIEKLISNGSKRKDIIVAIGPCISKQKYKVGTDVVKHVARSFLRINNKYSIKEIDVIESMIKLKILSKEFNSDKFLFDLKLTAYFQLIQEGILNKNITISNRCTFQEDSLFHSWRRDKVKERQFSAIISRSS